MIYPIFYRDEELDTDIIINQRKNSDTFQVSQKVKGIANKVVLLNKSALESYLRKNLGFSEDKILKIFYSECSEGREKDK